MVEDVSALAAAGVTTVDLLGDLETELGLNAILGITITRIVLNMTYQNNTAGTVPGGFRFGIIVVPDTVTSSEAPVPLVDSADWMWAEERLWNQLAIETAAGTFTLKSEFMQLNVKAQRKMEEAGDRLLLIVRNTAGSGTLTVRIRGRILIRLP